MSKTFFIADLHIGHKNCLNYDNRPFATIEENDRKIAENWNAVVSDEDDVYILGDVSWKNSRGTAAYYEKLKGKKHLIIGNHDRKFLGCERFRNCFVEIDEKKVIEVDGEHLVLEHEPIFAFENLYRGWIHLYGHVHNSFEYNMYLYHQKTMKALYSKKDDVLPEDVFRAYNVGCMIPNINYTPRTLEEIIK